MSIGTTSAVGVIALVRRTPSPAVEGGNAGLMGTLQRLAWGATDGRLIGEGGAARRAATTACPGSFRDDRLSLPRGGSVTNDVVAADLPALRAQLDAETRTLLGQVDATTHRGNGRRSTIS